MNIYIVSLTGWETYNPVYFEANCSQKEFKQKVQSAIKKVMPSVFEKQADWSIGGDNIYEPVLVELQKDKTIKRLCSSGEFCIPEHGYDSRRGHKKPDILFNDLWEKIIKHNKRCYAKQMREFYKEEKKKGFIWKKDKRYEIKKLTNGKTKLVLAKNY